MSSRPIHVPAQTTMPVRQKLQRLYLFLICISISSNKNTEIQQPICENPSVVISELQIVDYAMARRPGDPVIAAGAGGFICLASLLLIWTVCPPPGIVSAAWAPRPRFESPHQTTLAARLSGDAEPRYLKVGSLEASRLLPSIAPPPPPPPPPPRRRHRRKSAPPPHGSKTSKAKRRRRKDKNHLKSARTVGYFFAGIAMLLQVAVVVFLLIKRKQMIGVVHKYDDAPPEWNGVHAPA